MAQCLGFPFDVSARLSLGGSISEVVAATGWPDGGGTVAVIAHQPAVGRMAALLLSGQEADLSMTKGALW
jgi:phosphohistidine phosphatase